MTERPARGSAARTAGTAAADAQQAVDAADPATAPSNGTAAVPAPRDPGKGPPPAMRASTWWWIRAAAILLSVYLAVQLLGTARSFLSAILTVLLYVLFGAVIAFLAGPVVRALEERAHTPRTAAIVITLLAGLLAVVGIGYLIATPIVNEASQLSKQGPALIRQINDALTSARTQLAAHGIQLSGNGVSTTISSDVSGRSPASCSTSSTRP